MMHLKLHLHKSKKAGLDKQKESMKYQHSIVLNNARRKEEGKSKFPLSGMYSPSYRTFESEFEIPTKAQIRDSVANLEWYKDEEIEIFMTVRPLKEEEIPKEINV
jgi:hypothetical protein